MNIEILRECCISNKNVTESFPFDKDTLVLKRKGRIFALVNLKGDLSINLKCNPAQAIEPIERYSSIMPGYHKNIKHWNTLVLDDTISDNEILKWIDHSYDLVRKKK